MTAPSRTTAAARLGRIFLALLFLGGGLVAPSIHLLDHLPAVASGELPDPLPDAEHPCEFCEQVAGTAVPGAPPLLPVLLPRGLDLPSVPPAGHPGSGPAVLRARAPPVA